MPVGTGSINRASRASKKAVENVKKVAEAPVEISEEKALVKKQSARKKVEKELVFVVGNECCHLTEELPVHLL